MNKMFIALIIFYTLLIFSSCIALFLCIHDALVVRVPFISTRRSAVEQIVDSFELQSQSVVFDLGCGDCRILRAAAQRVPGVVCVGVERGLVPFITAFFYTRILDRSSGKVVPVSLVYADFFTVDLSRATHIYCYLFPFVLTELSLKIQRACAKGTRIISCDFPFLGWTPQRVVRLEAVGDALSKTLYIYLL